jgi:hypothetical protein
VKRVNDRIVKVQKVVYDTRKAINVEMNGLTLSSWKDEERAHSAANHNSYICNFPFDIGIGVPYPHGTMSVAVGARSSMSFVNPHFMIKG